MIIKHAYIEQMGTDPVRVWATDQAKPIASDLNTEDDKAMYRLYLTKWEKSFRSFPVIDAGAFMMLARFEFLRNRPNRFDNYEVALSKGIDIPAKYISLKLGRRTPDGIDEIFVDLKVVQNFPLITNGQWYAENGTVYNKADESVRICVVFDNGSCANLPNDLAEMIAKNINAKNTQQ